MTTTNFMITGVGGQGTILCGDILAAVGLDAGYDVKKSDTLGLAVRGGAVVGQVRWGDRIYSPIIPEGCVDYLIAFETLEGVRWLHQLRPLGSVLLNQQEIDPVTVSSGLAAYPSNTDVSQALAAASEHVYRVPGLAIARDLGNARVLNVVLLGSLSALLPVDRRMWQSALTKRVPAKYLDLNLRAFRSGLQWMEFRRCTPCESL